MVRKKETLTLSVPPGTKEKLDAIADRLGITWGTKPSPSGLVTKIAEQEFEVALPFALSTVQVQALHQAVRDLMDTGHIEEAKNVKLNYTTAGKTKAILTSPLMLRVQDSVPYYEFPKTVLADFYNETGVVESKLSAMYAKYKEAESVVFLKDSVKVINMQKGDTLYCKQLYWNRSHAGKEFYTTDSVRIRTKTQILDGVGMEASQDFKDWLIIKPTGIINVPSSKFPM